MLNNLFNLKGKVAIVTGSSRGIGLSIAKAMALHGAKVVISGRKNEACKSAVSEVRNEGGEAISVLCDITKNEDLENLINKTRSNYQKIDILVCNAGISPFFGPAINLPDDKFDLIMRANVRANIHLSKLVLPEMKKRKDGVIIITSSVAIKKGNNTMAYSISKAAVDQLVRNLAVENSPDNIRINAIAPGLIKTHFSKVLWENEVELNKRLKRIPMRRIGYPDDLAGIAVLLASQSGSWITGQTFFVDGGDLIDI